jgi:hypothetical protein
MGVLTTKQRKHLQTSQFAGPGRTYPIQDAAHARNALARVAQQENAGNLTKTQADAIEAKAHAALLRFHKGKK